MAVVKADGYGHGLERVARALSGADAFGVAALSDAERLRAAGLSQPIVLLSGFDDAEDLPQLRRLQCRNGRAPRDPVADARTGAGRRAAPRAGSSSIPACIGSASRPRTCATRMRGWRACRRSTDDIVLMNHFASSDEFDEVRSARRRATQMRVFAEATAGLAGARSLANSAAVLGWPDAHVDWVRPGGALYGISVVDGKTGARFRIASGDDAGDAADRGQPRRARANTSAIPRRGNAPRTCRSVSPRSVTATATRATCPRARLCW